MTKNKSFIMILALGFTLLVIASYSLSTGEIDISLTDVFQALFSRSSQYNNLVIQQIRVPRILSAIFIGATLSASGLLTNISMKNPLADSSILGIQSGATVGALVALLLIPTLVGFLPVFAFIGGLLAFTIIAITSSLKKSFQPGKVVLVGVAINSVSTSLIGVFTIIYAERIKNALSWLNGSLVNISQADLITIIVYSTIIIALVFFLLPLAKILLLDDTAIINIGYNPKKLRIILSLVAVLLASISVSFAGIISFVGIIAPQIARRLVKDNDLKIRMIASMLIGSLLVVSADLIQRLIFSPIEIPVGVLIGLVGAPIFIFLAGDEKMLQINNLALSIEDKQIFKDINFTVNKGEFVSLIGPNGSGKSSIIKVISRLTNTFNGKVSVLGKDFNDYKIKDYSKILSTMAQHQSTTQDLSVFDRVAYGRFPHLGLFSSLTKKDIEIIEQAIKDCELEDLRDAKLTNLSGGELQRVFLASCLAQEPELLILDEPTNHLDVLHQYKLLSLVRNQSINKNLTVLCVLHDINQAIKFSDRLCILKDGQLLHNGQAKDIITEETILDVFGIHSKIYNENNEIHVDFIYN